MKRLMIVSIILFLAMGLIFITGVAQAQSENKQTMQEAVNAGNKICPVSQEKIDEQTKATYEYKGKVYNFCCVACIEEFKKDPQKYIQKVEEELKSDSAAPPKQDGQHPGMMRQPETNHQGHHH